MLDGFLAPANVGRELMKVKVIRPADAGQNPKSEGRNPKEGRRPNAERNRQEVRASNSSSRTSGFSDFGFRISFGLRISAFGFFFTTPWPA